MMERVGMIVFLAVVLVQIPYFRKLFVNQAERNNPVNISMLVLLFGIFAVVSNLTGIVIDVTGNQSSQILTTISPTASIANTRSMIIGVSGMVGGPIVGTLVGLIAGVHRVYQGGGGGLFYIISSPLIGWLAAYLSQRSYRLGKLVLPREGALIALILEGVQLAFIGLFSSQGWRLVQLIGLPMLTLNAVGTFIFLWVIDSTLNREEQARAIQTHDVLGLTRQTLPFLREGLTMEQASQVAELIQAYTKASAVSLTNRTQILAFVGEGSDHHKPTHDLITNLSKEALEKGEMQVARSRAEIGCSHPNCPLEAAIVMPLFVQEEVVGTLKFYFTQATDLSYVTEELAEGLASIFSMQMALGQAETQTKLLQESEIKALQAQINPHFFYNMINVIVAIMRFDPNRARSLLLDLSAYFRQNVQSSRETLIPLEDELNHLQTYLNLTEARFPDRYQVNLDIDPQLVTALVPALSIQVLVENAINHAFGQQETPHHVKVKVERIESTSGDMLSVEVQDNGEGIVEPLLNRLGKESVTSEHGTGTALHNLAKRIQLLYGDQASFKAQNLLAGGACFTLNFPLRRKQETVEGV
ncbi:sensor histidine kinase [Suicoccus acidiformans]|uniref:histidine kinase n=1 Tax=Suicoccus acidiformans TaxID=2036206 RepID=A0A347WNN0_9LACT|nr:LytS/YhcK type 5TM receptor domain-containing protein [Suicoccus acidiformans]AXY26687.1 sensor histidine kinase [Suicoccus acidiformans]